MFLLHKHCLLGRVTPSSGGQLRGWDNLKWVGGLDQKAVELVMKSYGTFRGFEALNL